MITMMKDSTTPWPDRVSFPLISLSIQVSSAVSAGRGSGEKIKALAIADTLEDSLSEPDEEVYDILSPSILEGEHLPIISSETAHCQRHRRRSLTMSAIRSEAFRRL